MSRSSRDTTTRQIFPRVKLAITSTVETLDELLLFGTSSLCFDNLLHAPGPDVGLLLVDGGDTS